MYTSIDRFVEDWRCESANTAKVMGALTNASLSASVGEPYRTLGRVAWHIVTTIPEMMGRAGLAIGGVDEHSTMPFSAMGILSAYKEVSDGLCFQVQEQWTDATLEVEDEMYGNKWARGMTLEVLVRHEIHHRGQMTVLMRKAGLRVPGVYGPSLEEWEQMGMSPPTL